ncbi:MAG: septal ring lytic transglycosylase RlpA family protein [Desulfovibrionaceae bacterium]|nr:septal ring lytic transglycosylase RlpA family protein [Desulfovibrionaceae bacterium]
MRHKTKNKSQTRNAGRTDSREIWLQRARENADVVLGKASWYGADFNMGATASGVPYNMYTFTAAHRSLPFGTIVRVTDQYNGKSVMVCVTDRGPFVKGRIIDMSYAAANRIGLERKGVSTVGLEVVSDSKGRPLNDGEAFFVEMKSPTGPERFGPYDTFADAAAVHEALLLAHPEASVVLGSK